MHALRIGRVFGIEVRVDVSWLVIAVLMTWNLFIVFSQWHPAWTPLGVGIVAAIATLLFFGCVLLHELAHSLVARGYGVGVRDITLFLFGGVSDIEHEPPSPRAEFFTAIAGPLTSIVLGMVFAVLASFAIAEPALAARDPLAAMAQLGPVTTLLAWLGPINVVIGLFNLVPGFPLDGGRVLRSIVWHVTGDLRRSTHTVATVGQAIGWSFVFIGIAMSFGTRVPFFGTGLVGGLWVAFIGWFLRGAARQATVRLDIDAALAGRPVAELMRRNGPVVSPDTSLAVLVHDWFVRTDERALPVLRDGRFLGLVTIADVGAVPPELWATTAAESVMQAAAALVTTTPDRPAAEALEMLAREDVEQLPVVSNGALVGMIRRSDIARWLELVWRGGAPSRMTARAQPSRPIHWPRPEARHA